MVGVEVYTETPSQRYPLLSRQQLYEKRGNFFKGGMVDMTTKEITETLKAIHDPINGDSEAYIKINNNKPIHVRYSSARVQAAKHHLEQHGGGVNPQELLNMIPMIGPIMRAIVKKNTTGKGIDPMSFLTQGMVKFNGK